MIDRHNTNARLSQAVMHNGTAYLCGQVASNLDADMEAQTAETLTKIDRLLGEIGTDKSKLLSAIVFVSDISQISRMNAAWEAWMPENMAPARATVQAQMATPRHLVEIKIVAAL